MRHAWITRAVVHGLERLAGMVRRPITFLRVTYGHSSQFRLPGQPVLSVQSGLRRALLLLDGQCCSFWQKSMLDIRGSEHSIQNCPWLESSRNGPIWLVLTKHCWKLWVLAVLTVGTVVGDVQNCSILDSYVHYGQL